MARRIKARIPGPVKVQARRAIRWVHEARGFFVWPPNHKGLYNSVDPQLVREYNKTRPLGPKRLVCYLPFNSVHFCSGGRALACCYNQKVVLGVYPKQSVREIWFGEAGKRLREHMEHNDLSMGCQHCEYFLVTRAFTGLKAPVFDKYSHYREGQYPKVMEFDLTNTCNLECIMCNGSISSAIRRNRDKLPPLPNPYDAEFLRQLEEFIPHLKEAKFFGGEPFLIDIYYDIWERIAALNPEIELFVMTNGTILTDRVRSALEKGRFRLGVSIDGATKETYERIRPGARYEQVMKNLEYFNEYVRRRTWSLVISTTLMRVNWEEVPGMIEFCNRIGATIYLSYLKKPEHLALWNLEPYQLEEIHHRLAAVVLPERSEIERANKRCYQDFLHQLCYWKETRERGETMRPWC